MKAKSKKPPVLVTGSAGLIGTSVVEAFASDFVVIGMDVKRPEKSVAGSECVECDLTKDESVTQALNTVRERHDSRVASVIHLAAYYDFSGEPSEMYDRLMVEGTLRLLKRLKDFQVERFVFSSTILVMEPSKEGELLTEVSPLEDEPWDYPRSKIKTEQLIRQEHGGYPHGNPAHRWCLRRRMSFAPHRTTYQPHLREEARKLFLPRRCQSLSNI